MAPCSMTHNENNITNYTTNTTTTNNNSKQPSTPPINLVYSHQNYLNKSLNIHTNNSTLFTHTHKSSMARQVTSVGHLASVIVVVIFFVLVVVAAEGRTITTLSNGDEGRAVTRTSEQSTSSSENHVNGHVTQTSSSKFNRECFSIGREDGFTLDIQPPSPTAPSLGMDKYTTDQTVTLTCEAKRSQAADHPPDNEALPDVFISSCRKCMGYLHSELRRGKTELEVKGETIKDAFGKYGCQFSCWRYNASCLPDPDLSQFQPALDCLPGDLDLERPKIFRTVFFSELPRSEGVQCVSRNYEDLKCKWTLSTGFLWRNQKNDKALVSFCYPRPNIVFVAGGSRVQCDNRSLTIHPSKDNQFLTVDFVLGFDDFNYDVNYTMAFVITTDLGDVIQNHTVFTSENITQYEAVKGLKVTGKEKNSTVLDVAWTLPIVMCPTGITCRLQTLVDTGSAPWLDTNRTDTVTGQECRNGQVMLTGLAPHVRYRVHVQFRCSHSPYWSDVASASGNTTQDVPSRAPEVTPGGYVRTYSDTGDWLTVYVKPPPLEFLNGELTGYQLEVSQHSNSTFAFGEGPRAKNETMTMSQEAFVYAHEVTTAIQDTFPAQASGLTVRLGGSGRARACVRAGTVRGFSPEQACFIVPSATDPEPPSAPEQMTVEYLAGNGSYVVRWGQGGGQEEACNVTGQSSALTAGDKGEAENYTIFWCLGPSSSSSSSQQSMGVLKCRSKVQWQSVGAEARSAVVTLPPAGSESVWKFGVASVKGGLSKGVVTSTCTFREGGGSDEAPSLRINEIQEGNITVTWSTKCDVPFFYSRPLCYRLFYREVTKAVNQSECPGNESDVTAGVDNKEFKAEFSTLRPGATYMFCLRTFFAHGGSVQSHQDFRLPQKLMSKNVPKDNVVIVVLSVALPAIFLMVLIITWLCKRSLGEKLRKFSPFIRPLNDEDLTRWTITPPEPPGHAVPIVGSESRQERQPHSLQFPSQPPVHADTNNILALPTGPQFPIPAKAASSDLPLHDVQLISIAGMVDKALTLDVPPPTIVSVCDPVSAEGETGPGGRSGVTGEFPMSPISKDQQRLSTPLSIAGEQAQSGTGRVEGIAGADTALPLVQSGVYSSRSSLEASSESLRNSAESVSSVGADARNPPYTGCDFSLCDDSPLKQGQNALAEGLSEETEPSKPSSYIQLSYAVDTRSPSKDSDDLSESSSLLEDLAEVDSPFEDKQESVKNASYSPAKGGFSDLTDQRKNVDQLNNNCATGVYSCSLDFLANDRRGHHVTSA